MGLLDSNYRPDFGDNETKRVDWILFFTIILIAAMGAVNLYSATYDPSLPQNSFLFKQLIFYGAGLFLIAILLLFDYRILDHFAYLIYMVNYVLLLGVFKLGVMRNGQRLWYDFKILAYQPSETMKLAMIMALAKYFHGKEYPGSLGLKELVMPLLIVGIPTLTVFAQPDFGTGLHMALIGLTTILFFGIRKRIVITTLIVMALSAPLAWKFVFKEYHRDRVRILFDPMLDPRGKGYNSLQAMIAVGSGQISGKGFKQGTQTQLGFTPEGYTDFIFTVLAEEWGWLGSMLALSLYIVLIYRCVWAAAHSREKFGALVAIGITSLIAYQTIINLAMVIGLFPIVGIPLPLASYGGSSVITICLALGLVLNIGYRRIMF